MWSIETMKKDALNTVQIAFEDAYDRGRYDERKQNRLHEWDGKPTVPGWFLFIGQEEMALEADNEQGYITKLYPAIGFSNIDESGNIVTASFSDQEIYYEANFSEEISGKWYGPFILPEDAQRGGDSTEAA